MNCHEFKEWLINKDILDQRVRANAGEHLQMCERCKKVYELDSQGEARIKESLRKVELPEGLLARIEVDIQSTDEGKFITHFSWKILVLGLVAAALLFVILNPFPGRFKSIEEIAMLAGETHLSNPAMAFRAGEVIDVPGWFEDRLGFKVSVPDLEKEGFQFLSGRECPLGKKDVAHLFYEKEGERVSLFIINPGDLAFDVEQGRRIERQSLGGEGSDLRFSGGMI
jgi:hypothetical protein